MSSSAEALAIVRDHVIENGVKLVLGDVQRDGGNEIAGLGFDRLTEVQIGGLDERVFPEGVLTGRLACRAVLLEPGISDRFVDRTGVEGAMHLRTRLEYDEPGLASIPDRSRALSVGGPVTHVAVHNLLPGVGQDLDAYYADLAKYDAAIRNGDEEADGSSQIERPLMPAVRAMYGLNEPGAPTFNKGIDFTPRAQRRLELRRTGFAALQAEYPATRVLSVNTQGFVSQDELMDWAVAFTAATVTPLSSDVA